MTILNKLQSIIAGDPMRHFSIPIRKKITMQNPDSFGAFCDYSPELFPIKRIIIN